jgi:hypothetical protein
LLVDTHADGGNGVEKGGAAATAARVAAGAVYMRCAPRARADGCSAWSLQVLRGGTAAAAAILAAANLLQAEHYRFDVLTKENTNDLVGEDAAIMGLCIQYWT